MSSLVNTQLGKYHLQAELGAGGMGAVYRSTHPQLSIPVAIKVVLGNATPDARQRFLREAQTAAQLAHPNIVRVLDIDEDQGIPYIVMELVEGSSLAERILKGRIPPAEAVEIALQLADTLAFAHQRGVLHRDLKPANVLIRPNGAIVLVDFGLARLTDETNQLTQTGMIIGTIGYMAPEQLQARPLDGRTDLYALGVILFQMLTGRLPFEGDTAQMMFGHVYGPPPSPATLGIPMHPGLDALLQALLAKEPAQRPQRAEEVADALRKIRPELDASQPATGATQYMPTPSVPLAPQSQQTVAAPLAGAAPHHASPPPMSPVYPTAPPTQALGARKVNWLIPASIGAALVAIAIALVVVLRSPDGPPPPPPNGLAGGTQPTRVVESPVTRTPAEPTPAEPVPADYASTLTYQPATSGQTANGEMSVEHLLVIERNASEEAMVLGTVTNLLAEPRINVFLDVVVFDADGNELLYKQGVPMASHIAPGQMLGWTVYLEAPLPENAAWYTVEVKSNEVGSFTSLIDSREFEVVDVALEEGNFSAELVGKVRNTGSKPATGIKILFTHFDDQDRVIYSFIHYLPGDEPLQPGEERRFSANVVIPNGATIDRTEIFAEGTVN